MLTKLWCFFLGGVLITLGIMGNEANVMDKWEAITWLGFATLIFTMIQALCDALEEQDKRN